MNSPDPRTDFLGDRPIDLSDATVLIAGVGSLGGALAWILASAGVRHFRLIDRDVLEADNLRRHVCGRAALGRPKVDAVAEFLQDRFDGLDIAACHTDIESAEGIAGYFERCDLALVALDREAPKYVLDALARTCGVPAFYAGVYGGGWGGEVVRIEPGGGPCYACTARHLGRGGIGAVPTPGYRLEPRLPNASDWIAADLRSIHGTACFAARMAVAMLSSPRDGGRLFGECSAAGENCWRLAFRTIPAWNLLPGEHRSVIIGRSPGCLICTSHQGSHECPIDNYRAELSRKLVGSTS